MSLPLIKLENVSKYYTGPGGVGLGLRKVNCEFNLGEFVIITGESGSGKTTLLNVISGMDTYEEGTIFIEGEDTTYFGPKEYEEYRRNYISFIFQDYNLVDSFTVIQNVELALLARGIPKSKRKEQAESILSEVGLTKRQRARVAHLSGGEKQRVAIARALAQDAPIIACDEITGNLDKKTGEEIIALLKKVSKDKLVLLVSHDPEEAIEHASRMLTLHDGMIEKDITIKPNPSFNSKPTLPKLQELDQKTVIGLSLRLLVSTPRRTLFMFLIFFVATVLCAYAYSLYANLEDNFGPNYEFAGSNFAYYPGRIIVKKEDSSPFSNEEIENLKNIDGVRNIVQHDLALETQTQFRIIREEYSDTYATNRSSNDLKKSDLSYGRLPESADEVVICVYPDRYDISPKDIVGEEIEIGFFTSYITKTLKVVGVIESTSDNYIYLFPDFLEEVGKSVISNYSDIEFITSSEIPLLTDYKGSFSIKPNPTLDDFKTNILIYVYSQYDENEPTTENLSISLTNIYEEVQTPVLEADITYEYSEEKYDRQIFGGQFQEIIEVSENNYNLITQNVYQISITADNVDDVDNLIEKIETGPYYAITLQKGNNFPTSSFNVVLQFFIVFVVLLLIFGIYSLSYLSLKNIVYSQNRSYLTMRSLGIEGSKIRWLVYLQLFTMTIFVILITIALWIILNLRLQPYFLATFANLSLMDLIIISIIMLSLTLLLSYRYSKKIISTTIITRESV